MCDIRCQAWKTSISSLLSYMDGFENYLNDAKLGMPLSATQKKKKGGGKKCINLGKTSQNTTENKQQKFWLGKKNPERWYPSQIFVLNSHRYKFTFEVIHVYRHNMYITYGPRSDAQCITSYMNRSIVLCISTWHLCTIFSSPDPLVLGPSQRKLC